MTPAAVRREQQRLLILLPLMEDRLRRVGLYQTAAAQNTAVKKIGWEMAAILTKEQKARSEK